MNNYSTTLPPGFTTWNELLNDFKHVYPDFYNDKELDYLIFVGEDHETPKWYKKDFIKARAYDEIMDNKITRVEVINHQDDKGRDFVKYGCDNVELQIQDEGRTLKIFITATH